jgi:hypothetical protein
MSKNIQETLRTKLDKSSVLDLFEQVKSKEQDGERRLSSAIVICQYSDIVGTEEGINSHIKVFTLSDSAHSNFEQLGMLEFAHHIIKSSLDEQRKKGIK